MYKDNKSKTTVATSEAGIVHPYGAPEFHPVIMDFVLFLLSTYMSSRFFLFHVVMSATIFV